MTFLQLGKFQASWATQLTLAVLAVTATLELEYLGNMTIQVLRGGYGRSALMNSIARADIKTILACHTKTEQSKEESELGCRYFALLQLPYLG